MNARTVFVLLGALAMGGNVFAETETKESAEPETAAQARPSDSIGRAASHLVGDDAFGGAFLNPREFGGARIKGGMFEEPSSASFKIFGAGMFIAAGADLASTEYGLGRAGVYEVNPMQGNRSMRILTHAAVPAFMYFVTQKLHDRGKPKLALLARIGFTVGYGYVVMHNLRTASLAP